MERVRGRGANGGEWGNGRMKQPNKPVYRALGNPTRGKVTESKVTVEVDLAARSIGN